MAALEVLRPSACQVLGNPYLLDQILTSLPMTSLLKLHAVGGYWRRATASSDKSQRAMYLKRDDSIERRPVTHEEKYGLWHWEPCSHCPDFDATAHCYRPNPAIFHVHDIIDPRVADGIVDSHKPGWWHDVPHDIRRTMFLTQPPLEEVAVVLHYDLITNATLKSKKRQGPLKKQVRRELVNALGVTYGDLAHFDESLKLREHYELKSFTMSMDGRETEIDNVTHVRLFPITDEQKEREAAEREAECRAGEVRDLERAQAQAQAGSMPPDGMGSEQIG